MKTVIGFALFVITVCYLAIATINKNSKLCAAKGGEYLAREHVCIRSQDVIKDWMEK